MRDIGKMTLEQKIGQLICVRWYNTEEDKKFLFDMLKKGAVGAVQVRNFEGRDEFIEKIKKAADYPVLICADMEHGFPGSELKVPHTMSISSTGSTEYAYELARTVAIEAKAKGYNVVWGPVVDIASRGAVCRNPRCLSDDAEVVSDYALSMIKGYQDEGMIVSAKHYLNPPDILDDTHMKEGLSLMSEKELLEVVAKPYVRAIKEGNLTGVMTGHFILDNIDNKYIASLSEKAIGKLRELGFDGLVFTDSMAMMGIARKYGMKESLGLAIKAGNDIILHTDALNFKQVFEYLMDEYKKGAFSEERLNDAVSHVLHAQELTLKKATQTRLTDKQINAVKDLSKLALCVETTDGVELPLKKDSKKLFVLLCEDINDEIDNIGELQSVNQYSRQNLIVKKELLEKEFPGCKVLIINEYPYKTEVRRVCYSMAEYDETVFFTFNQKSSYVANDDVSDRIKYIINSYEDKVAAVVHMGNPYALEGFKYAPRKFWGTTGGDCEYWAIKALKGEFKPTGKFPVNLEG